MGRLPTPNTVIPAKAGIQSPRPWIPVYAEATGIPLSSPYVAFPRPSLNNRARAWVPYTVSVPYTSPPLELPQNGFLRGNQACPVPRYGFGIQRTREAAATARKYLSLREVQNSPQLRQTRCAPSSIHSGRTSPIVTLRCGRRSGRRSPRSAWLRPGAPSLGNILRPESPHPRVTRSSGYQGQ